MRWSHVSLGLAIGLLALLSLQYPLQTTFPIGGDVVRLVNRSAAALEEPVLIAKSRYPASTAILAATVAAPVSWPERFTWLITLAYLGTGLSLGYVMWRHFGWQQASVAMAVWALGTTRVTHHFEDATLPQLLSLPALVFLLDQMMSRRSLATLALLILTGLLHPLTGLLATLVVGVTVFAGWLALQQSQSDKKHLVIVFAGVAFISIGVGWILRADLLRVPWDATVDLNVWRKSAVLLPALAACFGWIWLWIQPPRATWRNVTLTALLGVVLVMSLTHAFGLSPLPHRYDSALLLVVAIGCAIAIPQLLSWLLPNNNLRFSFAVILFATLGIISWQQANFVYRFYEAPGNYARPTAGEIEAMQWLANNLEPEALIVAGGRNRHSEWIPILGRTNFQEIDNLLHAKDAEGATHLAIFHNREELPDELSSLVPIYENDDAAIFSLTKE